MVVAGYLFFNTHLRVKKTKNGDAEFLGLPNSSPPMRGRLTTLAVKERTTNVLRLLPSKIKNLVIVNSNLSTAEMIEACVEVADKHAENVMVIPPLLARLTYALKVLSHFHNPPKNECILVVTIISQFIEFVILRRHQIFGLYVAEYRIFKPFQYKLFFTQFYAHFYPHSTIFLVQKSLKHVAEGLEREFHPENCFIREFEKWDYVLLYGGMLRAMDDEHGFDTRYHIFNFSSGFETKVYNSTTGIHERKILLKERSPLPCNIYGYNGQPHMITVLYAPEYYWYNDAYVCTQRSATVKIVAATGSLQQIIGYVDERGIAHFGTNETQVAQKDLQESTSHSTDAGIQNPSSSRTLTSVENCTVSAPIINFIFRDDCFAVEVSQNGTKEMLVNSVGNEWTPLYLSTVEGTEIGEKAKINYNDYPRHVIYDVLKIIGKPMNEIQIDPKWGFELMNVGEVVHFQVETSAGTRSISQELVIAAFMKVMKLQTQSKLDTVIKEIHVGTNLELNESQQNVFKEAAAKNDLQVLSFVKY